MTALTNFTTSSSYQPAPQQNTQVTDNTAPTPPATTDWTPLAWAGGIGVGLWLLFGGKKSSGMSGKRRRKHKRK